MDTDFVTVATFEFANQAELARQALEGEGIRGFIADAELVTMNWFVGPAVGYIKLQVPASQAKKAAAILASMPGLTSARRDEAADHDGATACLACGAKMSESDTSCPICGWSYEGDEEVE